MSDTSGRRRSEGGRVSGDEKSRPRRSTARREPLLDRFRRWWAAPPALIAVRPDASGVVVADPLAKRHRDDLTELASRLDRSPDGGGRHLAARLRIVLAHDGPDLPRVIMAQVQDADAAALEAQVAALRTASAAWDRTRAPYARDLARALRARADRAHRDWLTLKRVLDARWGVRAEEPLSTSDVESE